MIGQKDQCRILKRLFKFAGGHGIIGRALETSRNFPDFAVITMFHRHLLRAVGDCPEIYESSVFSIKSNLAIQLQTKIKLPLIAVLDSQFFGGLNRTYQSLPIYITFKFCSYRRAIKLCDPL